MGACVGAWERVRVAIGAPMGGVLGTFCGGSFCTLAAATAPASSKGGTNSDPGYATSKGAKGTTTKSTQHASHGSAYRYAYTLPCPRTRTHCVENAIPVKKGTHSYALTGSPRLLPESVDRPLGH